MKRINLDRQWKFRPASTSHSWWVKPQVEIVDLPHDFSIIQKRDPNSTGGASHGFFPGGVYIYEKVIPVTSEWKNKKVILEFEGVYMNATVRFNSHIVAKHPYGYTSFHCDLTPYLLIGKENIISVTVNNSNLPNSHWYSGSGIYRHVWLLVGEKIHITPWGVFATSHKVSHNESIVTVNTEVENSEQAASSIKVRSTLINADGHIVTSDEAQVDIPSGSISKATQNLKVYNPNLWSTDNPYLYTLKSEVIKDNNVIDSTTAKIGIRYISFDAKKGFMLNGVSLKLKGACVHHDCGILGSAAYDRAEERKVELLKSNGFNAVRCAHNPPSPAFLDACDRLGMLVIDEAFDCWREGKNPNDYSVYFDDWWQRDLASMVKRDRNHPSIIMWSTGNEIKERDGRSDGYANARKLADYVRSLDNTRAVTNSICVIWKDPLVYSLVTGRDSIPEDCDYWDELSSPFAEPLDVVGYNYLYKRYEQDGKKYPERIICGMESYPKDAFDSWEATKKLPFVIGDFVWTGIDYLGEAGIGHIWYGDKKGYLGGWYMDDYPCHHAGCGDIDICGFKRPQSYYRDCIWGIAKSPYIAVYKPENYGKTPTVSIWGWADVMHSWTWPGYEGKPTVVDVYSTNSEVELVINGRSLERKPAGKANRYIASFEVVYEPGELVAIAYEDGCEVSRSVLRTAGAPAAIKLTPDRDILKAEFGDLSYITAELLDSEGNLVPNNDIKLHFSTSGAGTILAVGNGNPYSEEMYIGNERMTYEGRALIVIRSSGDIGIIQLTASAEGLPPAQVTIKVGC